MLWVYYVPSGGGLHRWGPFRIRRAAKKLAAWIVKSGLAPDAYVRRGDG
jgi:hypothetical protein